MSDPTALPNFPPPPNVHPLRGRVLDVLQDLQLTPNVDDDGDVAFMVNDQQLFVRSTDADLQILRLFGQWKLDPQFASDPAKMADTCNTVNLTLHCAKTGLANDTLICMSEHVVTENSDLSTLVQVSIQVTLQSVHIWHQLMMGIDPATGEPMAGGQS